MVFVRGCSLNYQGEKEALRYCNANRRNIKLLKQIACCSHCKAGRRHIPACCRMENHLFHLHGAWSSSLKLFLELVMLSCQAAGVTVFQSLTLVCLPPFSSSRSTYISQGFVCPVSTKEWHMPFFLVRSLSPGAHQLSWEHTGAGPFPLGFNSRGTG